MSESHLRAWNVSALVYKWSYGPLAHQLDTDLFAYLSKRLRGAVVADCGCGPGVVARKMVEQGAARVFAIDANDIMLNQVGDDSRIVKHRSTMEARPLDAIRNSEAPEGFDIVLFKRSLYMKPEEAREVLENAYGHLKPEGLIAIVHPEKCLSRYAFGSPRRLHRHTPYHLFNRGASRLGEAMGIEHYTLYTQDGLIRLATEVAGAEHVRTIPTRQQAFNMVTIHSREIAA